MEKLQVQHNCIVFALIVYFFEALTRKFNKFYESLILQLCFWIPGESKSDAQPLLCSVYGVYQSAANRHVFHLDAIACGFLLQFIMRLNILRVNPNSTFRELKSIQ